MRTRYFIALFFLGLAGVINAQNQHFWDGIEAFDGPTDENPILASQIDFYFDKLSCPLPDSITLEINRLIKRTENNTGLRDFILWHLLERYQNPEYMTQDQVFVWLYDQYFSQLKIKDLNEANRAMIRDKAERLRRLALLNPAPDIRIGDSIDLQKVDSEFTVLFFYDHDCDLCHQEMQDLDSVRTQNPDIVVFAIDLNIDSSGEFEIRQQGDRDLKFPPQRRRIANSAELLELSDLYDIETTPLIYVLDRQKRIIAKKIRARQIPLVL